MQCQIISGELWILSGVPLSETLKTQGFVEGTSVPVQNLFFGNIQGTIGETSALAILIGAVILLVFKVIDLKIPLTYIGSFSVFVIIYMLCTGMGFDVNYLLRHLFGGGLMLGAWFMATDYVTTPITFKGQLVYISLPWRGNCSVPSVWRFCRKLFPAIIFYDYSSSLLKKATPILFAFGKGGKKS